jgi:hypothetical protein
MDPDRIHAKIAKLEKDLFFAALRHSSSDRIRLLRRELAHLKVLAAGLPKGLKKSRREG